MPVCYQCGFSIGPETKFCPNCGAPQPGNAEPPVERVLFNRTEDIEAQLSEQFFLALKHRVTEEHDAADYQHFSERVYESGFRDTLSRKALEIEDRIQGQVALGGVDLRVINQEALPMLEDLLDYFIIRFYPDLCKYPLPESILKHPYGQQKRPELKTLVLDYLDLNSEKERIYFDLLTMPSDKLENAGKSYLFPLREEAIWFICDTSIFGNAKEGFAVTNQGLYWRMPFEKPKKVAFSHLSDLQREKNWLIINGSYFNINPGLNLKFFKLLKKIQVLGYGL